MNGVAAEPQKRQINNLDSPRYVEKEKAKDMEDGHDLEPISQVIGFLGDELSGFEFSLHV